MNGPRRLPPRDGLDRALAAGRTRLRRRRLTASAAGASAAVAVAAALSGHAVPGATDRLVPAASPSPAVSPVAATPSVPALSPAPSPSALPALPPGPGPSRPPSPPPDAPSPEPTASPAAAPPRRWVGPGPRNADGTPAVHVSTTRDPAACARPEYAEHVARTGFCTFATGPRALRPGDAGTYAFTLCRASGSDVTLTYRSAYETSFVAYDATADEPAPAWEWGDPAAFPPDEHTLVFHDGDCRTWRVEWRGQDSAGWAVADGTYEVLGNAVPVEWTAPGHPVPPPPASVLVDVAG
ncbi:MAG TPA: hypothetical protein VFQ85_17910 [Mycobacteriales bacterium]|jgi:hypothetical protein|nr:hypothetical protein [Mycobacteriales bacterium]